MELTLNGKRENITSLELLEKINQFREEVEGKNELQHKDLLKVIRDEFEEEIGGGKFSPTYYKDSWNRGQPMYILTFNQAKQVLVRESKKVRRMVIEYIEVLEKRLIEREKELIEKDKQLIKLLKQKNYSLEQENINYRIYCKNYEEKSKITDSIFMTNDISVDSILKNQNNLFGIFEDKILSCEINIKKKLNYRNNELISVSITYEKEKNNIL